ncbi:AAA domain-containing protein [Clostridium estertheticum]|uniref:AAA domain-containing protein n=1 Tax=Clostridium estertheticum TaxID=238834 RepID=UPI001CF48B13|nr:AAA domain-containing protein [Clostridium estertheticum]MCB2354919.1 AAA domain-containing protein [Clostridium estertheticum]WAG41157.1 AAA domain-containing protein [Clostridium estertheticum]
MNINDKVEKIFSYLLSIKNMNQKTIRNINEYEKVYWEKELQDISGCTFNIDDNKEYWLSIDERAEKLYNQFQKTYLQLEKNSEDLEIIWSNGLLSWEKEDKEIIHPIFTTKMEIKFDSKKKRFTLKPYNNQTNVELEFLNEYLEVNLDSLLKIRNKAKDMALDVRNIKMASKIFEELALLLNSYTKDVYIDDLSSDSDILTKTNIQFYNAPCIILRKVDTRLWNMELNDVLSQVRAGFPIPKTVEALVSEEEIKQDIQTSNEWKEVGEDVLFPLPANEEQMEITKKLSENFGVVIQGPPGTGKSHSIANLICHLLAHGKRVLVTSQTDRALRVLSNKIPEEVRALCISILGNDTKSLEELDESVRKITESLSMDTKELRKEIKLLKYKHNNCVESQKRLYKELKCIDDRENEKVEYAGQKYTLMYMAKWVKDNEVNHSWIVDKLDFNKENLLTSEEFKRLVALSSVITKQQIDEIDNIDKYIGILPREEGLCDDIEELIKLGQQKHIYEDDIKDLSSASSIDYGNRRLLKLVDDAIEKFEGFENSWLGNVMKCYYSNSEQQGLWKQLAHKGNEYIKEISKLKQELNNHKLELPSGIDINTFKNDFAIIAKTINEKGKLGGLFKILHGNLKYIFEGSKVDYECINTSDQIIVVDLYIKLQLVERELKNIWNNTVKEYGGKLIDDTNFNYVSEIVDDIKEIYEIINWDKTFKNNIINFLPDKNLNGKNMPSDSYWYEKETYIHLKNGFESLRHINRYNKLSLKMEEIKTTFNKDGCLRKLQDAIDIRSLKGVQAVYIEIRELMQIAHNALELKELCYKLKMCCPLLLENIINDEDKTIEDLESLSFEKAWTWRKWNDYLQKLEEVDIEALEKDIARERSKEKQIIRELVSKRSWFNQIERTTEAQKRSLFTWMEAIKRIGKGTGTQAVKYRKIAQKEMDNCKDVIPVWIMPINRVMENLKLTDNLFDVVIVDESSQSDISAITVLMRAKKAIIVGDEKQISPEAIGKDHVIVETLISTYLEDIPHAEWFDLKTSLYNTALRVFPSRLLLKEHFRCVPEIIGFSNELCYSNEIIPLRRIEEKEKVGPFIVTSKVIGGYKDKTKVINVLEAESIVAQILECCSNERYKDMSMGVISLLGDVQAELILSMLVDKLGMEEILKRRLICGDAYSFQGDERDVMFLSMVIANNAKFAALTKDSDIRRFNVAASRARNQMWLFHSVDLEDLNDKCVRYALLKYCIDENEPKKEIKSEKHLLLNDFEENIGRHIKENGYKITPKVKVGKYIIDFVVETDLSIPSSDDFYKKIAVKCIGMTDDEDYDWKKQYEMQMCLERVGWEFYKIRASEFYRNPTLVMEKLIEKLKN